MNKERSSPEKKRIRDKKHSMLFRFLTTVIVAMFAVAIFIGGLSIYEVDHYVHEQAQAFVNITCANEASTINDSLGNMEQSVKIMESYLMDFFENESDIEDRAFQKTVIQSADKMFHDVIAHTSNSGAIAYYFRLNPAISDNTSGLYYGKPDGGDEFLPLDPTDLSLYAKDDTEHVGWFWQPYEAGVPIWMEPYYIQNSDTLRISYVIPMYVEETFIGVVGMDFDYTVLSDRVHEIEIYERGYAHLENHGVVICNARDESDQTSHQKSTEYLRVSEELVNGMTLTLSASYDDIRQIRDEITYKIFFASVILFALFSVIAIFIVKKIVDPLKKLTDASVKLSGGDYSVEIVHGYTREVNLLSTAFEDMAKRLCEREELLRRAALYDSLTGLRNTTSYTLWEAEFNAKIQNKQVDFGMVVLDLNNLKQTNDEYGHGEGNELIVTVAKIISDVFRECPIFRIGGDEFLVVLQNHELENRATLFEQFELKCAQTFVNDNADIPVSIALGFAGFDPGRDTCLKDVFKRADDAMYKNKRTIKME